MNPMLIYGLVVLILVFFIVLIGCCSKDNYPKAKKTIYNSNIMQFRHRGHKKPALIPIETTKNEGKGNNRNKDDDNDFDYVLDDDSKHNIDHINQGNTNSGYEHKNKRDKKGFQGSEQYISEYKGIDTVDHPNIIIHHDIRYENDTHHRPHNHQKDVNHHGISTGQNDRSHHVTLVDDHKNVSSHHGTSVRHHGDSSHHILDVRHGDIGNHHKIGFGHMSYDNDGAGEKD